MINNKPTFWVNFTLFALAAFAPLAIVLGLTYSTLGLNGLLTILAVFVVVGLPIALFFANLMTKPVVDLAIAAQQIALAVNEGNLRDKELKLQDVDGTSELEDIETTLGSVLAKLQQQVIEIDTMYAIGQTVTQELEYDETVEAVLSAVAQVVAYDAAEIAIFDGKTKLLVDGWRGEAGLLNTKGREYTFGRGLAGTIAESREPLLVPIVTEDSTDGRRTLARGAIISEMLQRTEKVVVSSFLGVPLLVKDNLVGVMTLVHRDDHHFTEQDKLQLMKLMAQSSIAMQNAIEVREREASLRLQIRELQIRIDEVQKKKDVDAVVSSEYFKELRDQAKVFRRSARSRRSGQDKE